MNNESHSQMARLFAADAGGAVIWTQIQVFSAIDNRHGHTAPVIQAAWGRFWA